MNHKELIIAGLKCLAREIKVTKPSNFAKAAILVKKYFTPQTPEGDNFCSNLSNAAMLLGEGNLPHTAILNNLCLGFCRVNFKALSIMPVDEFMVVVDIGPKDLVYLVSNSVIRKLNK